MALRHTLLIAPVLLAFAACETAQENPNYKYSSTYGQQAPQALAQNSRNPNQIQVAPVRYETVVPNRPAPRVIQASSQTPGQTYGQTYGQTGGQSASGAAYTRVNHECLNQERRRTLIGAGLGGTLGAIAGNKILGGTKGTVIGAAAGGAAGYGLGDQTLNCDPIAVQAPIQQAVITPAYSPVAAQPAPLQQIVAQPVLEADYTPSLTENTYSADTLGTPGFEAMQQSQSLDSPAPQYNSQYVQAAPLELAGSAEPQQPRTARAPIVQAATPSVQPAWPQSRTEFGGTYVVKSGDTVYSLSRQQCTTVSAVQSLNNLDQNYNIQLGQTLRLPASECL